MMDLLLSDIDSFSESSSSEDQDDIEIMYGGQAHCILSSLEETIGKIDDFLSFERGFIPGDIVCSVKDPSGEMGRVINVDMTVDLENVCGNKIEDVNSKNLRKIRSFSVGDDVVHGPWLGKVDKIVDRLTILFDDGTKCEFTTMGPEKLVPISPDLLEDSLHPYYPGQRVKVELSNVPKSARWLCGKRKEKSDEGTVCTVDAGSVYVNWLGCALVGGERMPAPSCLQDSKNLTLLQSFSHANWQLGDWCILPTADHNSIMEQILFGASSCGLIKGHSESENKFQRSSLSPNFQELCVIMKTKTKVDVLWQDGRQLLGLDPQSLIPINIVDAHDFWPEQFVLEKGSCDDPHVPSIQRCGVVKCVDAKERTVKVKWKKFAASLVTDCEGEQMEEIVSAYELTEHPDYSYTLGEVVFRLEKGPFVDLADGNAKEDPVTSKTGMVKCDLEGKCYDNDQNQYPNNSYLSRIGMVVGFKNGDVEVKWASGLTTKVAPYGITGADKYEGLHGAPVLQDVSVEELNEEMTEHHNQSLGLEGKDLLDFSGTGEDSQKNFLDSGSFSFPRAAIGFFMNVAASLFGTRGSKSFSVAPNHVPEDGARSGIPNEEEVLEFCNLCTEEQPLLESDLTNFGETNLVQKVKETQEDKNEKFLSGSQCPDKFKHFDMVSGCSDHHFVDGTGKSLMSCQVNRGWLKKVQQEWNILEKDIPDTIYVRVYEERMDLIRAAIIGAPGTPYHDGLFFFDIFLPPEYPCEPPMVYYNSGGLRVNPNLYESGKVCLSLLNTWTGTGSEVWNSGSSTILQVLLSLQALVLNEKPYFNEAGYDNQMGRAEGEKNSESYNENAFLVSCKSMLYLLRKPPKHFEALVMEHFRHHGRYILLACKTYMEGIPVGCAFGDTKKEQENPKGSSTGFKIMLGKLFPKLVEAFSDKGIDCSQFAKPENECEAMKLSTQMPV
ncbi:unnamed protein product [Ilex paraguariensis]|uniref:E2 ubiquitin-conjugating enzyme n=1 Tax=Ilex paraguariensis TaxID=185542 RepID=A0ABC8ULJ3_9AQUA